MKTLSWLLLCLLCTLSCTPKIAPPASQVQTPPSPPPLPQNSISSIPMDPAVRIGRLSNGMTYYIRHNTKPEQRVELRLALKAGSMQEDDDQLGLAHFIEHMAFNGTQHFSKNELINYLETVGSRFGPDLNAYTSFDETVYMLQVRTDDQSQLEKGLLILRDWANGISFDTAEIDKERGVVISEWRSGLSSSQRMQQEYLPMIFFNSRYARRLPIGDPEIVRHASYDVVKRFYNDWYRPELMAVFAVGDIDPDALEKLIVDQFSGIKVNTFTRKKESNDVPSHPMTLVRVITDAEATNANVQLIYKHKNADVLNLLDYRERLVHSLYNRMLGRRLSDLAKQANPPFIFGNTNYGRSVGELATYTSFAMADAKDVRDAFSTLAEENRRVLRHGFTQSELDREKAAILQQAEQGVLEEEKLPSARIVQRLISHYLNQNPIPNAMQHRDMYASMLPTISVEEVSALAKRWIRDQNRVIIVTGPEKDKGILPDSAELIQLLQRAESKELDPYQDEDISAPLLAGSFPPRPVASASYDPDLDIHHWSFENGVKVSAKATTFKNDEILMNAYSPGGHSLYDDKLYPSARSAGTVIDNSGVGPFNATALGKKLTGIRASARPFIFERYEGLNGSSSVKDAETLMQLTYSYITNYREDPVALSSYLNRERATFANLLSDPNNWFSDKVTRISTQNHLRRGFSSLESYDQVKLEEILEIYKDRFGDVSDMHFFFVGNFDPDSLKRLTGRYLGALPGNGRNEMWKDVGARYPKGIVDSVYYHGEAPKTLVQMIFHGPDVFDPDTGYVLQSLVDLARIKLREEMREEEGGVYGVSVGGGQSNFPEPYYSIRISFNAEPARTEDLIRSARKVIEQLKTRVDPLDIVKITETQRQSRIKDIKENFFWMNAFITCWMNDYDMKKYTSPEALEASIAYLNEDVLLRAARKYFQERDFIQVVMHPEKK